MHQINRREMIKVTALTAGGVAAGQPLMPEAAVAAAVALPALGTPRGMPGREGRVVWQHNPDAVTWDGSGNWWVDSNTDQALVETMLEHGLRNLADEASPVQAWDALFRHFNGGSGGYIAGEQIAIKVNLNCSANPADNNIDATQHTILAMLRSLIHEAGVPAENIVVYDATHNTNVVRGKIPPRIYDYCRAGGGELLDVVWVDSHDGEGITPKVLTGEILVYAKTADDGNQCGRRIPTCVHDAKYLINIALLKGHGTAGVTLTAKNHYGTINPGKDHKYINPLNLDYGPLPRYSPFVDIIGSPELGGKTLLYMIDALYGSLSVGGTPTPLVTQPFNNRYPSSFLLSLDPVAIDSVGLDLLADAYAHPDQTQKNTKTADRIAFADNYLREAALAHDPPSGVQYVQGGQPLGSLGIHERADLTAGTMSDRYQAIQLAYNEPPPVDIRISCFDCGGDNIQVEFTSTPACSNYTLQACSNLHGWTEVTSSPVLIGPNHYRFTTAPPPEACKFFRVVGTP